ncbi:MAG: cysteine desulfurase family protein [Spirochaetia bacterium]
MIYLDWAATGIPEKKIQLNSFKYALDFYGNPSSMHTYGKEASELYENARKKTANALSCNPENIVFTSGGTESNHLVLYSLLYKQKRCHIITTEIEHASVHNTCKALENLGFPVTYLTADSSGLVSPDKIAKSIQDTTGLISIIHTNNETGAVQNIKQMVSICREQQKRPIHFHTDAVQSFGKIPVTPVKLGVDSLSISAHKIGGPRGIGCLFVKNPFPTLSSGGGQEFGMRSGTENTSGVYAFQQTMEHYLRNMEAYNKKARTLMDYLISQISQIQGIKIVPYDRKDSKDGFTPYIISITIPPIPGEVIARVLNDRGFAVSTGSACSAGKKRNTRVLEASGVTGEDAFSSIRISIGHSTTKPMIDSFLGCMREEIPVLLDIAK